MEAAAQFFIRNHKFTLVVTFGIAVFGYFGLKALKAESYPAVDFATATITTIYDGATAEDIETRVTKPIEDEVRGVAGVKDVRSVSQAGRSSIVVRVDMENENVREVMSDLQRAVDRVTDLPGDLRDPPKFIELKSEEFPVAEIAIIGGNDARARDLVVDLLKEEIEDNKAVLSARPAGFRERVFQVVLDPERMKAQHIGVDEVVAKIQLRNQNIPGGKLEQAADQRLLRIEGKVRNAEEIEEMIVRANFSGRTVRLRDIGSVRDSEAEAKVLTHYNGQAATLLIVTKKAGTDTLGLVDDIDEKIRRFRSTYDGKFRFVVYENEAKRVANKLAILTSNAVTGLGLVLLFLLLFLPFRTGVVASLSLPICVLAVFGFMPVFGMNLDAITILALVIALGMLVDNSVVISENFTRLRSEGASASEAAARSISQLWMPITATVLTTMAAFLPMLVTQGIMGEFIKYIPIIVSLALLVSLGESFFLLPMRLIGMEKKDGTDRAGGDGSEADAHRDAIGAENWFDRVAIPFERGMRLVIRHRYLALMGYLSAIVGSMVMMIVFNKMVLFPADQTEKYIARLEMVQGSTLPETKMAMETLSQRVLAVGEGKVDHVVSRSGTSQVGPLDPKAKDGDNMGMLLIIVNEQTRDGISDVDFLKMLRANVAAPSGVADISYEAMVNGPPVGEPVNATIRSNSTNSLTAVVDRLTEALDKSPGIIDVKVNDVFGDEMVYVDIDYRMADRLGLNVDKIGNAVRTAVSGKVASSVNLDNKDVDINIRFSGVGRDEIADLERLRISDARGNLIPLATVAKFRKEPPSAQIKRFDFKRSRTITANIEEDKTTAIEANQMVADAFASVQADFPEASLVFGGEGESTKESMDSLWAALRLSLIGIFALLVLLFNSFVQPFIIMTTIPLGLVGFSIAFAAHGRPISFLALIGIIGLGGIIVNSGIILISFIVELREAGQDALVDTLAKASRLRLRAVVVSSLTTISGLLPTAYGIGGSDAMLTPMTLAMAWGLTSGTILTLVWVPCAYHIVDDLSQFFGSIRKRMQGRAIHPPTLQADTMQREAG